MCACCVPADMFAIGVMSCCGCTLSISQSLAGMTVRSPTHDAQGDCDLWSFERIPRRIFQWSKTSCGLVSHEQMARTCACDVEFLKRELEEAPKDWETILALREAPRPQPSVAQPPEDPLPGDRATQAAAKGVCARLGEQRATTTHTVHVDVVGRDTGSIAVSVEGWHNIARDHAETQQPLC